MHRVIETLITILGVVLFIVLDSFIDLSFFVSILIVFVIVFFGVLFFLVQRKIKLIERNDYMHRVFVTLMTFLGVVLFIVLDSFTDLSFFVSILIAIVIVFFGVLFVRVQRNKKTDE